MGLRITRPQPRLFAVAVTCMAIGCANGGTFDTGQSETFGDAGIDGTGSGGSQDSGSGSGGRFDSSSGSGGGSDSGSSGGDSGGPGMDAGDDGGGGGSCTSPDTCTATAPSLGTIAGDKSGATLTQTGSTSEWLRIDLQEKDSGIVGVPMKLTATLTSPPGTNYDLYAYLGGSIGAIECTAVKAQSTNPAGQDDTVSFEWGETGGGLSNGNDDSATVMLEIRWVSGTCSTSATWSLSAHGH